MGTRNITRVVLDGEMKVNQYCQFDGYPTSRGADFLKFVSHLVKDGEVDHIKELLRSSHLVNEDSAAGAKEVKKLDKRINKLIDQFEEIEHKSEYKPFHQRVEDLIENGTFSLKDASLLMAATRDPGHQILPFMLKYQIGGMTFFTDDYTNDIGVEGDWQIEGVYLLDFDKEEAEVWFHGSGYAFTFETLGAISDEIISGEMDDFESKVNEGVRFDDIEKKLGTIMGLITDSGEGDPDEDDLEEDDLDEDPELSM